MAERKGFTLIELLVVIAIIGVIASIVLASLNSARAKGADAAIKSNIHSTRTQGQIFYDDNGTFDGICSDAKILSFRAGATNAGSLQDTCADTNTAWALEAQVKTNTDFYCVDSEGATIMTGASSVADGSDYVCGP